MASMLTTFLFIVPAHLATVLFAVAAADPAVIARKLRFALRLSYMIGLPGMAALILGAHTALALFGKGYAQATIVMWLITLGYPASVPRSLYIAVCRANDRIPRAATVLTACTIAEIAASAAGGLAGGLYGLSLGLLAVRYAEALVTTPPVLRAAFGHGRHRRAELPAAAGRSRAQTSASHRKPPGPPPGTGHQPGPALASPRTRHHGKGPQLANVQRE
jgi:O-antigen/teichoic acid export membrane protein